MVKVNIDCFKNASPSIRVSWDLFCSEHRMTKDGNIYITKKEAKYWKLI